MKRILLVLATLLFMTGSVYALDLEGLCGDYAAFKSPDAKVYSGKWKRTYPKEGDFRETAFAVIETTGSGRVLLFYGVEFGSGSKRCYAMLGSMSGETVRAQTPWRGTTLRYTLDGEGGATAKFERKNRDGDVISRMEGKLNKK